MNYKYYTVVDDGMIEIYNKESKRIDMISIDSLLLEIDWTKRDKMKKIFSGNNSKEMWAEINNAKTIADLRDALYGVCCKLQELESEMDKED